MRSSTAGLFRISAVWNPAISIPDGDTIGVYTTPESGSITIPLVEVGNYTIYERVPPEYHLMDEEPVKQVTVKYGEVAEVAFENEPYGDLRIEKIDGATGASLAGARIQIKHIESGATYTGTTGTGGSYTFTETEAGGIRNSGNCPLQRGGSGIPRPIPPLWWQETASPTP